MTEIIGSLLIFTSTVAGIVAHILLVRDNRRYAKMLNDAYQKDDAVLEYCLAHILQQSLKSEDYETATRCKTLLEQLKEHRSKQVSTND